MDGKLFVVNDEFAHLQIGLNEIEDYLELNKQQQNLIFKEFDFESLLIRIKKFYNAIDSDGNTIILSHDILDRKSKIHVFQNEIIIEKTENNMILPLLKRLFRNVFVFDIDARS